MEFFKRTFLRFIFVFFLYSELVNAMTLEEYSGDCPPNYREMIPVEFIECITLSVEKKFDEGIEILKKTHGDNKYFNADKINNSLRAIYYDAKKKFNSPIKTFNYEEYSFDPNITERDFIKEELLRYFWWNNFYPFYEGISDEIIFDYDKQYLNHQK